MLGWWWACTTMPMAEPLETPVLPELGFPLASARDIESPYGPRVSGGEEEFHLGLDFRGERGEPVLAAMAGTVKEVRVPSNATESLFVLLEHEVVPYLWQGSQHDRMFTSYHHLDSTGVSRGDVVTTGMQIGEMGDSGNARSVHLHMELRLGTSCSLEFQLANPDSACVRGFSPHVDPLMALPTVDLGGPSIVVEGSRVTVTAPRADPDIRRVETEQGTVDFSSWEGIENRSNRTRDDFTLGWADIVPVDDNDMDDRVLHLDVRGEPGRVRVYDARGRVAEPSL